MSGVENVRGPTRGNPESVLTSDNFNAPTPPASIQKAHDIPVQLSGRPPQQPTAGGKPAQHKISDAGAISDFINSKKSSRPQFKSDVKIGLFWHGDNNYDDDLAGYNDLPAERDLTPYALPIRASVGIIATDRPGKFIARQQGAFVKTAGLLNPALKPFVDLEKCDEIFKGQQEDKLFVTASLAFRIAKDHIRNKGMMSDIWRYAFPVARLRENVSSQIFYSDFDTADYARRADVKFDTDAQAKKLKKIKNGLLDLGPEGGVYSDGMDCFGVTGPKGLKILEDVLQKATNNVFHAILPDVLDSKKVDERLKEIVSETKPQELDKCLSIFFIKQRSKIDQTLLRTDKATSSEAFEETFFLRNRRVKKLSAEHSVEEIQALEACKALNELLASRTDVDAQQIISHITKHYVESESALDAATEEMKIKKLDRENFSPWAKSCYAQVLQEISVRYWRRFLSSFQKKQTDFWKKSEVRPYEQVSEDKISKLNKMLDGDLDSMLSLIPESIDKNKILKVLIDDMEKNQYNLLKMDSCKNDDEIFERLESALKKASDGKFHSAIKEYWADLREGIKDESGMSQAGRRVSLAQIQELPPQAIFILGAEGNLLKSDELTAMTTGPRVWAAFREEFAPVKNKSRHALKIQLFGAQEDAIKPTNDGSWT